MRQLHSLTGLVPASAFVVLHLATGAQSLRGQQAFDTAVARTSELPFWPAAELLGLFVPLAYHIGFGACRVVRSRPNFLAYPWSRNWAYLGQRLSGAALLVFLCLHLWQFRLQVALGQMNRSDYFSELCARLASTGTGGAPWVAIGFLVALAAVSFHLGNGLQGLVGSWGIARSLRANRWLSVAFGLVGVALFVVGASTVLYFATGTRIGVSSDASRVRQGTSCPEPRAQHFVPPMHPGHSEASSSTAADRTGDTSLDRTPSPPRQKPPGTQP
ncbi:succinate dehydrogenase [Myxococcota bacterium]